MGYYHYYHYYYYNYHINRYVRVTMQFWILFSIQYLILILLFSHETSYYMSDLQII